KHLLLCWEGIIRLKNAGGKQCQGRGLRPQRKSADRPEARFKHRAWYPKGCPNCFPTGVLRSWTSTREFATPSDTASSLACGFATGCRPGRSSLAIGGAGRRFSDRSREIP